MIMIGAYIAEATAHKILALFPILLDLRLYESLNYRQRDRLAKLYPKLRMPSARVRR